MVKIENSEANAIQIEIEEFVYHAPDAMGEVRTTALIIVYALFYVGLFTTPHLMMEEKQTKTIKKIIKKH